jgi:hypothetical protein
MATDPKGRTLSSTLVVLLLHEWQPMRMMWTIMCPDLQ